MEKTTTLKQTGERHRWAVVDNATGKVLATRQSLYQTLAAQRKIERERAAAK